MENDLRFYLVEALLHAVAEDSFPTGRKESNDE